MINTLLRSPKAFVLTSFTFGNDNLQLSNIPHPGPLLFTFLACTSFSGLDPAKLS